MPDQLLKYLVILGHLCLHTGTHHAQLDQAEVPSLGKLLSCTMETTHIHLLQNCCYTLRGGRGMRRYEEELSKNCSELRTFLKIQLF